MSQSPTGLPISVRLPSPYHRDDRHLRLATVERDLAACPDRYLVTLTTKRQLASTTFSNDLRETMNRVNGKLFGTAFKRGRHGKKVHLVSLAIQETTVNGNLHTHMIVGVPEGSLSLKANPCPTPVPDLILNTWIAGDPQYRRKDAQDARPIDDLAGARSYISKDIWTLDDFAERADLLNTTFIP